MYLSMLYSVQLSDQSNPVLLVHPPMRLATVILRHLSFCSVAYVSTHLHPTIACKPISFANSGPSTCTSGPLQPKESSPDVWIRGDSAPWQTRGDGTPGDWTGKGPPVSLFWLFAGALRGQWLCYLLNNECIIGSVSVGSRVGSCVR